MPSWCELCDGELYIEGAVTHPCCARLWNGRYCISCEASKGFWREQAPRRRRKGQP